MPEDFERLSKRLWRDKATGIEYRQAHGAPLALSGRMSRDSSPAGSREGFLGAASVGG